MILIYAFRDERGAWHGDPDAVILETEPRKGTLTVPAGPGEATGVFAGQRLTVLYADCELEASHNAYRLDGGERLPASWHVHELLAPAYQPDSPAAKALPPARTPRGTAAPGVKLEIGDAHRRYCLSADPVDDGRVELTVIICSSDGIIHGELTGEIDSGDLDSVARLITSAASACLVPVLPAAPPSVPAGVKAAHPGAPWTHEAELYLREGHHAGKSPAQLAQELGRSENSIRWKLYGLKLVPYPSDLVPAQKAVTAPEQPKAYTVEEKRQAHPRAYERWTPEEDARLSELHACNTPVSDMARELGRNEGAITSRLERIISPF
ncbi:hypothetical protein [Streptomyces sp. NPDC096311]|uniref:hypothetical protein n=1 Tax=Streptomyces sp. NPDC096311 TaxID=3366083 RepID=UPI0037F59D1F